MTNDENKLRFEEYRAAVDSGLSKYFAEPRTPQAWLFEAMRYSLLSGGKRIRPILTLEFCRLCGGDYASAFPAACAVEMIHTYSLIHDDLPCMDDDELRRGNPTNHIVYGEAAALLAGDSLLTAAFGELVCCPDVSPSSLVEAVKVLSMSSGAYGMAGGQMMDIDGTFSDEEGLRILYAHKTGALIRAAAEIGCLIGGGSDNQLHAARDYAENIGLSFQIRDDMLDVEGDSKLLGKNTGSDNGKLTFVSLYGLEKCADMVNELTEEAVDCARSGFEDSSFLEWLARELAGRQK